MPRNRHSRRALSLLEYSLTVRYFGSDFVCVFAVPDAQGWTVHVYQDGRVATESISEMELLEQVRGFRIGCK